eukprot:scaffold3540_cov135-Skeletonema_menzelii.AAC.2
MSSSTMNANNNHVAASTTQKYLPQLPMQHQHRPQHASPTKLIKLSPAQLFVLSNLRPQISMKTVEHDPLVAASAVRSKEKILFIASTESTERYTVTSSITTHSKTKCKKKAVIKKGNDYLVALSAARSERMLRDRRNRSKLMSTKKRDARNNCLVALSEMSPTEHLPVYRFSRSKKNVTSSTSPLSNVIINDMPPTTAVPSPRPAMQPSMAMADAHASAVPPQQPPTAPISSIPPTTEPTSSIPTTTTAPVSFVPPVVTSPDQPVKEQHTKTAEELKVGINGDLDKRPPVFVVGGDYVRRQAEAGACCVFLHSVNGTRIEGDIKMTNGPLLILRHIDDMSAAGYKCQYRFIHDNKDKDDNYVLFAFVGKMVKSNDSIDLPNDIIAEIYSLHKKNIISSTSSHHESYGTYYADGLKASYQKLDESQSSVGHYTTSNTNALSFQEFQKTQQQINACIHQANEFLINKLSNGGRNEDVIKLAANSSCVKFLNELYAKSSLQQMRPLDTLFYGEHDLHWCSNNVCINAGTKQYHTELDTSMTMILRPYFQSCCSRKCSQRRTTFNFQIPINGREELKIPLVDGCVILFSGYLLEHRQQNSVHEKKTVSKHNCDKNFVNISCYSNSRFSNNMTKTTERVYEATK